MARSLVPLLVGWIAGGCAAPVTVWGGGDSGPHRGFRPFWIEERTGDPERTRGTFLWPLGAYRVDEERTTFRFIPFHSYHARRRGEGPDWDAVTGLLLHTGVDPTRGGYAALLPIGGTLKNRFLKERIDLVLFPLFSRVSVGESRSYNVAWPFANITTGSVEGWKLWPFYGRYRKTDRDGNLEYDRTFVLWPFYTHHRNDLDRGEDGEGEPTEVFFLFPFYGSIEGPRVSDRAWFFPFVRHRVLRETGGSEDLVREDWRAPFPFVQVGSGDDYLRRDFWPFYGYRRLGDTERRFAAWPIWRSERRETEIGEGHASTYLLPFYVNSRMWEADGTERRSRLSVWPFYSERRRVDGSRSYEFPSPLWFEDRFGITELLGPFWRIYGRDERPDGRVETTALFGMVASRRRPDAARRDWSVFWGLFGRETVEGDRKTRFLFFVRV